MKLYKTAVFGLILTVSVFLSQCTQPDGYIGDWFGSWHLESIDINGTPDTDYRQNIMFSFQGKVFNVAYLDGDEIYGSWSYAGEILTLVGGYDAGSGSNSHLFNPFPVALHFPADVSQIEITVNSINSRKMQWQYIDQNGQLITYNLRKYP